MSERGERQTEFRRLVSEYRDRCLWFLREDYVPTEPAEMLRVLDQIERHGDRDAFVAARRLSRWLSRHSSGTSAAS
jgi:hypothetical protein